MAKKLIIMCLLSMLTSYGMKETPVAPPAKKAKLPDVGIKDLSEFINGPEQRSPEQTKKHQPEAKEYYHRRSKSADGNDDAMKKVAHAYLGDLAMDTGDLAAAALHYNQTGMRISRFDEK